MRVIAGTLRGRRLEAPPGLRTRPITDRVKESLFNVLGHRLGVPGEIPAIDVLDVFAGSGGLGIEALSRGAAFCAFVERDRTALRALRGNLDKLGLADRTRVRAESAWSMRPPRPPSGTFGLIFADPPYRDAEDTLRVIDLLERLASRLSPDGLAVLRQSEQTAFDPEPLRVLQVDEDRTFGTMRVVLLRRT